jgi:ubiquitin-conjugating enzyme E2 D/E
MSQSRFRDPAEPSFYSLGPISEENIEEWRATIKGPSDTPYEGGIFHLRLSVAGRDYPSLPPHVRFMTKIYHPNIDERGTIRADMLDPEGTYEPTITLTNLVVSICSLLGNPGWDEPLVPEIAVEYHRSPKLFEENARKWTKRYATSEVVFPGDREDGYYNTVEPPPEE